MYLAALSVIQAIILPNPSLHLTPYTVCITDPQGSEWAMRGRGWGGGSPLKVRGGWQQSPGLKQHAVSQSSDHTTEPFTSVCRWVRL